MAAVPGRLPTLKQPGPSPTASTIASSGSCRPPVTYWKTSSFPNRNPCSRTVNMLPAMNCAPTTGQPIHTPVTDSSAERSATKSGRRKRHRGPGSLHRDDQMEGGLFAWSNGRQAHIRVSPAQPDCLSMPDVNSGRGSTPVLHHLPA
jgi:hypothetical protein